MKSFALVFGIFLPYSMISAVVSLECIEEALRPVAIYRTLTKETQFDSCQYTEEFKIKLECVFAEEYYAYDAELEQIIDACMRKKDSIYSPEARAVVQDCIADHGTGLAIIPIAGMVLSDDDAFFVVPGGEGVYYLSLPVVEVLFLNEFEEKLRSDELMAMVFSEEDVIRYHLLVSLIHSGLCIIEEMEAATPQVCAYSFDSIDDIAISYHVTK